MAFHGCYSMTESKLQREPYLICRTPDLLVDFCHWQIQTNDFVVDQKLRENKMYLILYMQYVCVQRWILTFLPPCRCHLQAVPPDHSPGRSCFWHPSLEGQCQARYCCRGFLACDPAESLLAEDPFPRSQKTLSLHSPPTHMGEYRKIRWRQTQNGK